MPKEKGLLPIYFYCHCIGKFSGHLAQALQFQVTDRKPSSVFTGKDPHATGAF